MIDASERLVSIIRKSQELVALISGIQAKASERKNEVIPNSRSSIDQNGQFPQTIEQPLCKIRQALFPKRDQLLQSWKRLENVETLNEGTLLDVLLVLVETIPDTSQKLGSLPPLDLGSEPRSFKPTEAHPRAYKGTKCRPPKDKQFPQTDLRPYLSQPIAVEQILKRLNKFLPQVKKRFLAKHFSKTQIEKLQANYQSVWVTGHSKSFGSSPTLNVSRFPSLFLQHFGNQIKHWSHSEISDYLKIFKVLQLEKRPPLLWAVGRLVSIDSGDNLLSWCRLIVRQPFHRQVSFVATLINTEAYMCSATLLPSTAFDDFNKIASDQVYDQWLKSFFRSIQKGVSIPYLLAGFHLAAQFVYKYSFERLNTCDDFPLETVEELALYMAEDGSPGYFALTMWERCAQLSGFSEFLQRSIWSLLKPTVANEYFYFVQELAYHDLPEPRRKRKWEYIRDQLPRIENLLVNTQPAYQKKVIGHLSDYIWYWDKLSELKDFLPAAYQLVRRLAREPFQTSSGAAESLSCFLEIPNSRLREQFLQAPDASFHAAEVACRRVNDANLAARGLDFLTKHLSQFSVDAFSRSPKMLMKTAKALGSLKAPVREHITKDLLRHPLFAVDIHALPVREACAFIEKECQDQFISPIPAKLKAWTSGKYYLTPARIARYQRILTERLVQTRLDVAQQSIHDTLRGALPVQHLTKNSRHALQILTSSRGNKRALRKFLHHYWTGSQHYLARHPQTQAWYKKHPRVNREMWEGGISISGEVNGQAIQIGIEHDPLEILKMGTYVGSCLGLGGLCTYSAAAVLLDENKQVLFARDSQQTVVARQLIAISSNDELVCFEVYPISAKTIMKKLFKEYDTSFSQALGLPLYHPDDKDQKEYEIEHILSTDWWDDDAWNFTIDDE